MSGIVSGDRNMHYIGPNWGFSLAWDPTDWQVAEESSDSGRDYLELVTAIDRLTIEGYAGFDGDATACLDNQVESVSADRRVSRLELVPDPSGSGDPFESRESYRAFAQYSYDFTTDEGTFWTAWFIECHTLKLGEAVLVFSHVAYAQHYDEGHEPCCPFDSILTSLTLPRGAWERVRDASDSKVEQPIEFQDGEVSVLRFVARAGDDGNGPPPNGYRFVAVTVRFSNTGQEAIYANAVAIYLRDQYDILSWYSSYRWDDAPGDGVPHYQLLDPGASATATVFFQVPDDAIISSVHCTCFSDPGFVEEPIYVLNNRVGALSSATFYLSPSTFVDRQGQERAMFTVLETIGSRPDIKYPVHIENTGARPFLVDPEAFILHAFSTFSSDVIVSNIADYQWELAPGDHADSVQELAPGEHAVLYLTFAPADESTEHELAFVAGSDQVVPIRKVFNSVGGGYGRPRISRGS